MVLQVDAGEGIERGERFVEEKNLRPRYQRACDGDALGLAAGEFARPNPRLLGQADAVERARHARPSFRLRILFQAKADVVGDTQPGKQTRLLENDADLLMRRGNHRPVEHDLALGRRVEPRDRAQHGRLAAAGAADGDENFTGRDREREPVERAHAVGVGLADAIENEHRASLHVRANRSSQRRKGDDTSTMSQSVALPRMAKATMAATICAGLPSCWPSMRRKPSPVEAPMNSAATTNIQPRPSPARSEIT